MTKIPVFNFSLLHPRYGLIWIGIGILYIIVLLPYPVLYQLGTWLGRFAQRFMSFRMNIVLRNLQLCFPDMSVFEREILLKKNFESVGMGFIETGMAWFWPDWRIKRWFKVNGWEHMVQARKKHTGILLMGLHFLTLELGARYFGILNPGIGVYRTHDNPLLNWLQTRGRLRSNKSMLDRADIKGMIRALKNGEIIWYAPDHDYGNKSSVFVPLFAVSHAATTVGTYILVRMAKPALIPFVPRRLADGYGYELLILPDKYPIPLDSKIAAVSYINKVVEQVILLAPAQYMWLHRRFKTRPPGEHSVYN